MTIPRKTLEDLALWSACADHHNACAMLNPPAGTAVPPDCDCGLLTLRTELDDALVPAGLSPVERAMPPEGEGHATPPMEQELLRWWDFTTARLMVTEDPEARALHRAVWEVWRMRRELAYANSHLSVGESS